MARFRGGAGLPLAGGGGARKSSLVQQARVVLDHAAIVALPATPVEIVPAPGTDRFIILDSAVTYATTVAPYTGISEDLFSFARFWYGENDFASTITDPGTAGFALSSLFINGRITLFPPMLLLKHETTLDSPLIFTGPDVYAASDVTDQPIVFKVVNTDGNFDDGHEDNTFSISVAYKVFNVATGRFE